MTPGPAAKILLVIPCFRESRRLPVFVHALVAALRETGDAGFELLVVDDGSGLPEQDTLREILEPLGVAAGAGVKIRPLLALPTNRGKGAAIREGWRTAGDGIDWLAFVDADGAVPPGEVVRLARRATRPEAPDAIFASRVKMLGHHVERSFARHLTARVFATLVGWFINPEVYDSQCGLKFVRRARFATIAPWLSEGRFAFDVELLAALFQAGAAVEEVPIAWRHVEGSKVAVVRDGFRMAWAIHRIRQHRRDWPQPPVT